MKAFLYLASFLMIGAGAWVILYTARARNFLWDVLERINEKVYAAVALVFGVLFLASATASRHPAFLVFLGLLLVADGVVSALNPNRIYQRAVSWILNEASDQTYRLFGIIKLVLGTAIFSWI